MNIDFEPSITTTVKDGHVYASIAYTGEQLDAMARELGKQVDAEVFARLAMRHGYVPTAMLDECQRENAELWEERNHWKVEQTHAYSNWEDAHKRVTELESENAKLRKLVIYMHRSFVQGHDWGPWRRGEKACVRDRMRELGIEVDG